MYGILYVLQSEKAFLKQPKVLTMKVGLPLSMFYVGKSPFSFVMVIIFYFFLEKIVLENKMPTESTSTALPSA